MAGVSASGCDDGSQDGQDACLSSATARVCASTDSGGLTLDGEGLQPGSVVRATIEGLEPLEWRVSDSGEVVKAPGDVGFVNLNGPAGRVTLQATAADGSLLTGEIALD